MAHKLIGQAGNKPHVATSAKIIVDHLEAKRMLMHIASKTGESLTQVVVRLVEEERAKY